MNKSEQTIAKALGTETTKLTIANMVLRAENKELKQEIAKLKQDNVELKQEIAELRHHLNKNTKTVLSPPQVMV